MTSREAQAHKRDDCIERRARLVRSGARLNARQFRRYMKHDSDVCRIVRKLKRGSEKAGWRWFQPSTYHPFQIKTSRPSHQV